MDEIKISSTEVSSLDLGFPMPAQWNYMNISSHVPLDGLQMNANLVFCFFWTRSMRCAMKIRKLMRFNLIFFHKKILGVACMLSSFINMLGRLHYILQFACRRILFDQINKSFIHERRLF